MKAVSEKMGLKQGSRGILVNAPADAIESIDLPEMEQSKALRGKFDYIHLFVTDQSKYKKKFPQLKKFLDEKGMFWVSWPKGHQLGSDLTLHKVVNIGYSFGLVESTCLSINSTWSALKFTFPKQGKVYNNSHGKLKGA